MCWLGWPKLKDPGKEVNVYLLKKLVDWIHESGLSLPGYDLDMFFR